MIIASTENLVKKLIADNWQFMLVYAPVVHSSTELPEWCWEADFTKQLLSGVYDNHESGFHSTDPNEAIKEAYQNVKDGKRLKR